MAKSLTIGSCTFQYPEQGTKAGWGEEATNWAVKATSVLNTLSGANDINLTTVSILNDQSSAVDVGSGACTLSFSTAAVRSFDATYFVVRTDSCCVVTAESGTMTGVYNGTTWSFTVEHDGCAGMCFEINSCGQVQYYSDSTKGAGTMKFKAATIDQ